MLQSRQQQLEVLEGVAEELKTKLSGLKVSIQQYILLPLTSVLDAETAWMQ